MIRLAVLTLLVCACGSPPPSVAPVIRAGSEFSPLPPLPPDETNAVADSPQAARLGQQLFFDKTLSTTGDTSCATCHVPDLAFADARSVGQAIGKGRRNTPTVLNSAYNRWFFRDGRADSAWSQALKPLEDPLEMGSSRLAVARRVVLDRELRHAYDGVFDGRSREAADRVANIARSIPHGRPMEDEPDHPHARGWARLTAEEQDAVNRVFSDVGKAMAAYERLLIGGDSAFDAWREAVRTGNTPVVAGFGEAERRGLELFEGRAGCTQCHFGPLLSDGEFHNLGVPPPGGGAPTDSARYQGARSVVADPFSALGEFSDDRHGERAQTLRTLRLAPEDWGAFQTPGLRNVARTAPYMHAGQFATLREVLQFYSTLEGAVSAGHHGESSLEARHFTEQEIADLLAFLESLDEKPLPAELLRPDPKR